MNEEKIADACEKTTFRARMSEAGLTDLLDDASGPRKKCRELSQSKVSFVEFLDELGQRDMISAIQKSAASYSSGLKCWAAFCDALGVRT